MSNSSRAFVLDPRTLLLGEFEALVIGRLRNNYFNRDSETELHPKHKEESNLEAAVAMDDERLRQVRSVEAKLQDIVNHSRTEDNQLDWSKLTAQIREELPFFDGRVIEDCVKQIFDNPSVAMDLQSLQQLKEKGKLIFVFGNENGPIEEQVNLMIKAELLKTGAGEKKPEEIGISNLFLKDAVRDNNVLIINSKEHGGAGRPEKVTRVTDVLDGMKADTIVVDRELGLLIKVKDGSRDKRLKEGKRLFRIGPENSQTIPYGITRANSLAQFLIRPNQPEGQPKPPAGINSAK